MKLLIDMNLPPAWVHVFEKEGWSYPVLVDT